MVSPRNISALLIAALCSLSGVVYGQPSYDLNLDGVADVADVTFLVNRLNGDLPEEVTVYLADGVPIDLVEIRGGSFLMGSPEGERTRLDDEGPSHTVALMGSYYLSRTEVTQKQWFALMGSWPGDAPTVANGLGDNHPAYNVSWHDAKAFMVQLNALMGSTGQTPPYFRLPTEAEWEFACRGGTQTRYYFGDSLGGDDLCDDAPAGLLTGFRFDYMWYCGNQGVPGVKEAGRKLPNQYGLRDMSGNVWEWCEDWYGPYSASAQTDPLGPPVGGDRIHRGGGWMDNAYHLRSARRGHNPPDYRVYNLGFRVCLGAAPPLPTGAIEIDVTPDEGGWTLTGPAGFLALSGSGDRLGASAIGWLADGDYTLTCDDNVPGFDPPAPETQSLVNGTSVGFSPVYVVQDPVVMIDVEGTTFTMGRRDDGDDGIYGEEDELPRHEVTLSPYQIGKFEVTAGQYASVLNWALGKGYLENLSGGAYDGGDVYADGAICMQILISTCQLEYSSGMFSAKARVGQGGVVYSMAAHPINEVTWYGSVKFCEWLSEMEGLTPAYDTSTWELVDTDPSTTGTQYTNGYRLPTDAEWERAAAWDGAKHWIYGFKSDTLTGEARCNYEPGYFINPLGLTTYPYTSPVGWFDGVNVSPNGSIQTVDSPSPIGAYDMSGNSLEWRHDRYGYFTGLPETNPTGPTTGTDRVYGGGCISNDPDGCRSSSRSNLAPDFTSNVVGFRVARSPATP